MNLALLDPFRKHLPDRIDSTLTVPRALHPLWPQNQQSSGGDNNNEDERRNEISEKKSSDNIDVDDNVDALESKSTDGEDDSDVVKQDQRKDTAEEETKLKKRKKDTDKHEEEINNRYWTACYTVSFNQQGTALASAYASGLLPIHDFLSRTMSAVYWPPPPISLSESETCASLGMKNGLEFSGTFNERGQSKKKQKFSQGLENAANKQFNYVNGVTSLSWDRHNKTILAGAIGDHNLRLMDNSHPQVSLDCAEAVKRDWMSKQSGSSASKEEETSGIELETPSVYASFENVDGERVGIELKTSSWGRARLLRGEVVSPNKAANRDTSSSAVFTSSPAPNCITTTKVNCMRHPTLVLELPLPLAGPSQLHPNHSSTGLACLDDGSLILFHIPTIAFYETLPAQAENSIDTKEAHMLDIMKRDESRRAGSIAYLAGPPQSKDDESFHFITCATFGKNGEEVYAATKCGSLLVFRIPQNMIKLLRGERCTDTTTDLQSLKVKPSVCVKVPGASAAWQIILSRNGKHVLLNSADCALRLYDVDEISRHYGATDTINIPPRFVFQDTLSRSPWASCDFSADGEYVVGGCNSQPAGDNYNLFVWSSTTGELVDQLKGPQASLYCLSCHPTRSFIAVGTSDGVIDVWGPLTSWTAFAPDFQARQKNVLYEEKEDEFDIVVDSDEGNTTNEQKGLNEEETVDIITTDKTAAEMTFPVRVLKLFSDKNVHLSRRD